MDTLDCIIYKMYTVINIYNWCILKFFTGDPNSIEIFHRYNENIFWKVIHDIQNISWLLSISRREKYWKYCKIFLCQEFHISKMTWTRKIWRVKIKK